MNSIIFDFGGTLDTDGIHWCDKFYDIYLTNGLSLSKTDFKDAFAYSERRLEGILSPQTSLKDTFAKKISFHLEYLSKRLNYGFPYPVKELIILTSNQCYNISIQNIKANLDLLSKLKRKYKLALVSNYYGNLNSICMELTLDNIFSAIIDSTIISIRKPDPGIFLYVIDNIEAEPKQSFVVGDSYENDIIPAKSIGCKTIWLTKSTSTNNEYPLADIKISSLSELLTVI